MSTAPELDAGFLEHLLDGLADAVPAGAREAARLALLALRPADPLAAMLAAQAVAAHYAVMDAFRRAARPELDDAAAARLRSNAAGLARMMQATLRALQAHQAAPSEMQAVAPAPPRVRPPRLPAGPGLEAVAAPRQQDPEEGPRLEQRWEKMSMVERRASVGWRLPEDPPLEETLAGLVLPRAEGLAP